MQLLSAIHFYCIRIPLYEQQYLHSLNGQKIFSTSRLNSWTKFIHSHLYSFALRYIFLQTHATSYSFYSLLLSTVRRKEENLSPNFENFKDPKNRFQGINSMWPGGPVRQSYSYSVPSPHKLFKNSSTDRKPYPLPNGLRNPPRDLKSDNSRDYAQKPQQNCTLKQDAL